MGPPRPICNTSGPQPANTREERARKLIAYSSKKQTTGCCFNLSYFFVDVSRGRKNGSTLFGVELVYFTPSTPLNVVLTRLEAPERSWNRLHSSTRLVSKSAAVVHVLSVSSSRRLPSPRTRGTVMDPVVTPAASQLTATYLHSTQIGKAAERSG